MDKIKQYCHVEDVHRRPIPKNTANVGAQIEVEDAMIMRQIQPDHWIYDLSNCLCTSQTSENFGTCYVMIEIDVINRFEMKYQHCNVINIYFIYGFLENHLVVMLDENGSDISSEQMSKLVEDAGRTVGLHLH